MGIVCRWTKYGMLERMVGMIKVYCQTVLVWMIIIYCLCYVFEYSIRKNGYLDKQEKHSSIEKFISLLKLSAIPFFRLFVVFTIFLMATYPKDVLIEKLEELKKYE